MDNLSPQQRSWMMAQVKSKDTLPELIVRRIVFGLGYRYRLHDKRLAGKPDLVFFGRRKAIFVNGCFWHGHDHCRYAHLPKTRVSYWQEKIARNKVRDKKNIATLEKEGWSILTVWECETKTASNLIIRLEEFLNPNS